MNMNNKSESKVIIVNSNRSEKVLLLVVADVCFALVVERAICQANKAAKKETNGLSIRRLEIKLAHARTLGKSVRAYL